MDSFLTSQASFSDCNSSFEHILLHPYELRNSREIRMSQNLTSINNDPDESIIEDFYKSFLRTFFSENKIRQSETTVTEKEFEALLEKYHKYDKIIGEPEKMENKDESEYFTPENCYHFVPEEFFNPKFKILPHLKINEEEAEELNLYLDCTDLSVFHKMRENWEDIMDSIKIMQSLITEVSGCLENLHHLNASSNAFLNKIESRYLRLFFLKRRLNNIKAAQESLKLIAAVKETQPTIQQLLKFSHYSLATQLIIKIQETISSKLKNQKSIKKEEPLEENILNETLSLSDLKQMADIVQEFSIIWKNISNDKSNEVLEQFQNFLQNWDIKKSPDIPDTLDNLHNFPNPSQEVQNHI
ncbi:unnamed protein product [Blepharisma stoltei]|uniref:Vacuolar protein sorting-associated protein 54 N-terminal domain-containing protein n=1 Tax=Blepharisma stoltei TaxID=1481888 RepID=A0AAU9J0Y7_9CILI|nr:unnamed protein product [Blepharisma stoltei]